MPNRYCLNGVHTAGKSTVAKELERKGFRIFREIASEVIEDNYSTCFAKGCLSDDAFQDEVMRRELEREATLPGTGEIVETYHPGNIAHCVELASCMTTQKYISSFMDIRSGIDLFAIYIQVGIDQIASRSSLFSKITPDILDFYRRLEENTFRMYELFEIPFRIIYNQRPLEETVEEVASTIQRWNAILT